MAIASNESFSSWTKTFSDPRLCAAFVDRLTFGGNIIKTGTASANQLTPTPEDNGVMPWFCAPPPPRTR